MIATHHKIARCILGFTIIVLLPAVVHSYVLEGAHIIQLMAEKLGQAESLFVSQRVIFYKTPLQPEALTEGDRDPDALDAGDRPEGQQPVPYEDVVPAVEPETIQLDESLRYVFSEAFRSDIVSESNQRVYVFNQGQTITVIDGVISNVVESRFDLYKDLLLFRSREELSERLLNLGIDVAVTSLGKFDGQLALVIGAEYPDETVPQIWIDKETFQPLRLIITSTNNPYSNSTSYLEMRYSQWQPIGKIWYPLQIEFIQDGKTVRTIEVDDYQLNPNFSEGVFDIARLKSEYRQPVITQDQTGESEGMSEVQKTIEEFKKIFE